MKVMKFGGTSVGSPARMKEVARLINNGEGPFVVLSAMSGTTNKLVELSNLYDKGNVDGAFALIKNLQQIYHKHIEELYSTEPFKIRAKKVIDSIFATLVSTRSEKEILAQGEILSTNMMQLYLDEQNVFSTLIPALDFMKIDENLEPDMNFIERALRSRVGAVGSIIMTQGFICRDSNGNIDNLQRGGSDYTASIIGAVLDAKEVQIWTDIDGMHNNDPRYVENTQPVRLLNFDEAAELAYFGARILHPTCITPAKTHHIPVRLLNTMQPEAQGTLISNQSEPGKIKAIAAKDDITAIKIQSTRMLLATGFLRKIFEIFEKYQTPIDMITTSEVAVSVTIDNDSHLTEIIHDLKQFGTISIDSDMVIVSVVGDMKWNNIGFEAKVVEALKDIPLRMISYGGSDFNCSILVRKKDKIYALQSLSKHLF